MLQISMHDKTDVMSPDIEWGDVVSQSILHSKITVMTLECDRALACCHWLPLLRWLSPGNGLTDAGNLRLHEERHT